MSLISPAHDGSAAGPLAPGPRRRLAELDQRLPTVKGGPRGASSPVQLLASGQRALEGAIRADAGLEPVEALDVSSRTGPPRAVLEPTGGADDGTSST